MLKIKNGELNRGDYTLSNINIHIEKGSLNLVVGKNSTGKSSLLYTIIGSILLNKGSIEKNGVQIAYVGHDIPFSEELKITKVATMIKGIDDSFSRFTFYENLDKFAINKYQRVSELSFGQKRLFMLSIALSRHSNLLILDEITLNIDALRQEEIKNIFENYLLNGDKAIILSSNQLEVFEDLADSITYIKDDTIAYHGSILSLVGQYSLWQGSSEEFKSLKNIVAFKTLDYSMEALIKDDSQNSNPSLKDVLIYLEGA